MMLKPVIMVSKARIRGLREEYEKTPATSSPLSQILGKKSDDPPAPHQKSWQRQRAHEQHLDPRPAPRKRS
jgi:hypothetical protein